MNLDLPTLVLILFLIYLANGVLSALMAWSGRIFEGAWLWVTGQGLLTLGALALFLRPWIPQVIPAVVEAGAQSLAFLVFSHSIWVFRFKVPFPRWIYGLMLPVLLSLVWASGQDLETQILIASAWGALTAFFAGTLPLWRFARPYRVASTLTALPFVAIGGGLVARAWISLGAPPTAGPAFLAEANGLYLLGAILMSTMTLFGYFMMTGVRAEQIVSSKDGEISARNRKLIESGRAKDLFFSIIAHDLRGPIGGAARYVRKHLLGKMTGLEGKYTEVETLASALEKTNEFLEKLLWWSRAQLADWVPERHEVDLVRTFDQTLALNRSAADLKEISLHVSPAPYPRPWADPESVQLILGNLVSNAVKFSLPGRQIHVFVVEEPGICRITVQDEGVGMDRKTIDRLFRIEDKLTSHGTSGERGSGMGLLLAQSLAERNEGGISIESEPGVGTRATLWLPTVPPGPSPEAFP